jgi:hypothetical protein
MQGCHTGRPTVKITVRTSTCDRSYPADTVLPADRVLPSMWTWESAQTRLCVRAHMRWSARTRPCVRADTGASVRTQLCIRTDIGPSVRTRSSPCPRPPSVPPRSPCADGLLRPCGHGAGKERKKMFGFRFSIPKIPEIPELRGLRGRSREKKKVFSA